MRSFTESEKAVIRQLATWRQGQPGPMEEFLVQHVFTAQSPRGVIIQTQRRYAVLYHGAAGAGPGKPSDTGRPFFELLALLAYLRGNGYITLYNNPRREERKTLYYLHASFDNPRVEGNTIILNNAGDFTNHPEVILDKSHTLKFKGALLDADVYDLVLGNMTGTVCVSQGLLELLGPPRRPRGLRGVEWHKVAVAALVCSHSIFGYVGLRAHAAINRVATSVDGLRSQQEELAKKIPAAPPAAANAAAPAGTKQEYYGVDISRWNGNFSQEIDRIPQLSFAISKATEGLTLRDDRFQTNRKLLQTRGVAHGGYHLFRQDDDPVAQAEFFLSTVAPIAQGDISPVVDVEDASLTQHPQTGESSLEAGVLLMLKTLEARTGRSPILYTNLEFAQKYFASAEFAHYRLWLAEYTAGQPEIPNAWRSSGYFIWQKSASYKVGASQLDLDVYQGDRTELTR